MKAIKKLMVLYLIRPSALTGYDGLRRFRQRTGPKGE